MLAVVHLHSETLVQAEMLTHVETDSEMSIASIVVFDSEGVSARNIALEFVLNVLSMTHANTAVNTAWGTGGA